MNIEENTRIVGLFFSTLRQILPYFLRSNLKTKYGQYNLVLDGDHPSHYLPLFGRVIAFREIPNFAIKTSAENTHSAFGLLPRGKNVEIPFK